MVGLVAVSLPGLAALAALLFTWMQVGQATKELRISEQGQITSRFNAAIANLGSQSMDVRLGGIYALQRIMEDSARDHPTVVSVLAAFAQQHAGSSTDSLKQPTKQDPQADRPKADVRAATGALATRRANRDGGTIIDLSHSDLRGLFGTDRTTSIKLPKANFWGADLRWANLAGADLGEGLFLKANLENANLERTNLRGARFEGAKLPRAILSGVNLRGAVLQCATTEQDWTGRYLRGSECVDLRGVLMDGADLRNAKMALSDLRRANVTGTDFRGADLSLADFRDAHLVDADFRGATLTGVKLAGATRDGARGLPRG
ncbi:pentapeptide repeat-containing protein [Streptomyces sp. NPDC001552]|uniref:pentapeptide repeat-containing protein n=1 Tax=Streptomyces sp. NPDC001552 TaxID=3364587 RepID=UPI0036C03681